MAAAAIIVYVWTGSTQTQAKLSRKGYEPKA